MEGRDLLYRDEVFAIQGAIFEVSREMGIGFAEAVYQECLAREFALRSIGYTEQPELSVAYKGKILDVLYKPDFICLGKIIVELKVAQEIVDAHRAQIRNYLKATNLRIGLLVNFGVFPKAIVERFVV